MRSATLLLLGGLMGSALTGAAQPEEAIRAMLAEKYASAQIREIVPSPHLKGFYEIVTADDVIYSDAEGKLLILGTLIDTSTQVNLTARRWGELHKVNVASLPLELAIKSVRGNGARTLVVFADPDCPYCQSLEQKMLGLTDATVYTFLYPLEDVHPEARAKAEKIWCSPQRAEAWTQWMTKQTAPAGGACDAPVDRLLALGKANQIRVTPTLVFPDGRRVEGEMSLAQLEQMLSSAKAN